MVPSKTRGRVFLLLALVIPMALLVSGCSRPADPPPEDPTEGTATNETGANPTLLGLEIGSSDCQIIRLFAPVPLSQLEGRLPDGFTPAPAHGGLPVEDPMGFAVLSHYWCDGRDRLDGVEYRGGDVNILIERPPGGSNGTGASHQYQVTAYAGLWQLDSALAEVGWRHVNATGMGSGHSITGLLVQAYGEIDDQENTIRFEIDSLQLPGEFAKERIWHVTDRDEIWYIDQEVQTEKPEIWAGQGRCTLAATAAEVVGLTFCPPGTEGTVALETEWNATYHQVSP